MIIMLVRYLFIFIIIYNSITLLSNAQTCSVASYTLLNNPFQDSNYRYYNNCYNYAFNTLNTEEGKVAFPGAKAFQKWACQDNCCFNINNINLVKEYVIADLLYTTANLSISSKTENCPPGHTKVYMAISTSIPGFHFYRQDNDGKWSHKQGQTSPIRTPDINNPNNTTLITDPEVAANEIGYAYPAAYFCYCGSSVQGQANTPIQ